MPNYDQWTGVIRAVVPAILAYFVGKGWLTEGDAGLIVTAAVAIGAAIWSILNNRSGKVVPSTLSGRY